MTKRKLTAEDLLILHGLIDRYSAATVVRAASDIAAAGRKKRGPKTNDPEKIGIWFAISQIMKAGHGAKRAAEFETWRIRKETAGARISSRRMENVFREIERRRLEEPEIDNLCRAFESAAWQFHIPDNAVTIPLSAVGKPRKRPPRN